MTEAAIQATQASQLLEDPLLVEAFAAVEREAIERLSRANVADHGDLLRHTAAIQAVRNVREQIQSYVTTGLLSGRTGPAVA